MDLFAYAQIDDLEKIAKENGIEIPRLRGYCLMKDEKPVSQTEINQWKKECETDVAEHLLAAHPRWSLNPEYWQYDWYVDYLKKFYLVEEKDEDGYRIYTGIRWERIHGKKRKALKFAIKKKKKAIQKQYDTWNKYVGQDVLYIHSRVGGGNWHYMSTEDKIKLTQAPWFLDRVDDSWDTTYCDFYAKIERRQGNENH